MSNKKIFKLILSMVLVSIALIGGFYFYFSSKNRVVDNIKEDSIIYVKFNELFNINNIMPGWVNDGKTYIDFGNSFALKLNESENFDSQEFTNLHPNYYGIIEPFKIEIENKNNSYSTFKIKISDIKTNLINQEIEAYDQNNVDLGYTKNNCDNVVVYIYKDKISDQNIIYANKCPKSNDVILSNELSLNKGKNTYYILIEYKQALYNQNDSLNINLSGRIGVIGLKDTKVINLN